MRVVFKMIVGLIFDDWWLAIGLIFSIVLTYTVVSNGMDAQISGGLLLILIIGALVLSLNMEYRKKLKKMNKI